MSNRQRKTRSTSPHDFASVRADLQTAEAERRRAIGIGIGLCVLAIVILAVTFYSIRGASASPDDVRAERAAAAPVPAEPARALAVEPVVVSTPAAAEPKQPNDSAERATSGEELAKPPARKRKVPSVQRLKVAIGDTGYEPSALKAKVGTPIVLTVAQGEGCAAGFLIPELGIALDNSSGPVTKKLGTLEAGNYRFTCGMEMVEGVLKVR